MKCREHNLVHNTVPPIMEELSARTVMAIIAFDTLPLSVDHVMNQWGCKTHVRGRAVGSAPLSPSVGPAAAPSIIDDRSGTLHEVAYLSLSGVQCTFKLTPPRAPWHRALDRA